MDDVIERLRTVLPTISKTIQGDFVQPLSSTQRRLLDIVITYGTQVPLREIASGSPQASHDELRAIHEAASSLVAALEDAGWLTMRYLRGAEISSMRNSATTEAEAKLICLRERAETKNLPDQFQILQYARNPMQFTDLGLWHSRLLALKKLSEVTLKEHPKQRGGTPYGYDLIDPEISKEPMLTDKSALIVKANPYRQMMQNLFGFLCEVGEKPDSSTELLKKAALIHQVVTGKDPRKKEPRWGENIAKKIIKASE